MKPARDLNSLSVKPRSNRLRCQLFQCSEQWPNRDVENSHKYLDTALTSTSSSENHGHPVVDYTPPLYIALLFTDEGVLTPFAVSDELIKKSSKQGSMFGRLPKLKKSKRRKKK